MKMFKYLVILLGLMFGFTSCLVESDSVYDVCDYLEGAPWQLTKSVYYDLNGRKLATEIPSEEVLYKYYMDGVVSMKSTGYTHFGHIYEDWVDGYWSEYGDVLTISTRDGKWEYEIVSLSSFSMILGCYIDVTDDWGHVTQEYVEDYYER